MKNILITGVSRGLGLEIAAQSLRAGYRVFGVSRTLSGALEGLLAEFPNGLELFQYDLSDAENMREKIFKGFIGADTPLYGYVNNAAVAGGFLASDADEKSVTRMFSLNALSPIMATKHVLRNFMLHGTKGSIVHISSICAHTGYAGLSAYAATKGAIEAFSKNVAREWGRKGIRSNCVVAGFMETPMSSALTEEQRKKIFARTALRRPASAESVAKTVLFLLSEASESVTGQNVFADSGAI